MYCTNLFNCGGKLKYQRVSFLYHMRVSWKGRFLHESFPTHKKVKCSKNNKSGSVCFVTKLLLNTFFSMFSRSHGDTYGTQRSFFHLIFTFFLDHRPITKVIQHSFFLIYFLCLRFELEDVAGLPFPVATLKNLCFSSAQSIGLKQAVIGK